MTYEERQKEAARLRKIAIRLAIISISISTCLVIFLIVAKVIGLQ